MNGAVEIRLPEGEEDEGNGGEEENMVLDTLNYFLLFSVCMNCVSNFQFLWRNCNCNR